MNELALFAGAGGGILGTRLLGWRVVCAVERDAFRREALLRRQEEGILPAFPIWDDVRTFDGAAWRGSVDVITAGFPCQPFSVAGKRKGAMDERNFWPDTVRILRDVSARYALLENVPGLLSSGYFGTILHDLCESGYDARWKVVSAAELGAPHKRDRLWIVAHGERGGCFRESGEQGEGSARRGRAGEARQDVPDASGAGLAFGQGEQRDNAAQQSPAQRDRITWWDIDPAGVDNAMCGRHRAQGQAIRAGGHGAEHTGARPTQSFLGRVAHGVAYRVDRLRAIGNGQVPAVVRAAWELLT